MREIIVTPLDELDDLVFRLASDTHVCGLLGPEVLHPPLPLRESQRLKLIFHDVVTPVEGCRMATEDDMRRLLEFVRRWDRSGSATLVIHCWMGVSRSWGAAFISRCLLEPERPEIDIARELRALAPYAKPNLHLVRLADGLMGRGGRMVKAIEDIGFGEPCQTGKVVHWPLPA